MRYLLIAALLMTYVPAFAAEITVSTLRPARVAAAYDRLLVVQAKGLSSTDETLPDALRAALAEVEEAAALTLDLGDEPGAQAITEALSDIAAGEIEGVRFTLGNPNIECADGNACTASANQLCPLQDSVWYSVITPPGEGNCRIGCYHEASGRTWHALVRCGP